MSILRSVIVRAVATRVEPPAPAPGRPRATTKADITAVALDLFVRDGFEETTVDALAAAAGISRRTLFRYFPSKNDIVWGDFAEQVDRFRAMFAAADPAEPMLATIRRCIVAFNDYGPDAEPELRARMSLITTAPALQGHAMLRHAEWCEAIADFVAERRGLRPTDLLPATIAQAALGVSTATYRVWLADGGDLLELLDRALRALVDPEAEERPSA
jgi:mycofactocin system transcriptional regulator